MALFWTVLPGNKISKELNADFYKSLISDTNGSLETPISQCFYFSINHCQITINKEFSTLKLESERNWVTPGWKCVLLTPIVCKGSWGYLAIHIIWPMSTDKDASRSSHYIACIHPFYAKNVKYLEEYAVFSPYLLHMVGLLHPWDRLGKSKAHLCSSMITPYILDTPWYLAIGIC